MADLNLFIAGTGSTSLRDNRGDAVGLPIQPQTLVGSVRLLARDQEMLGEILRMEHRLGQWAPVKTSYIRGRSLLPGHIFMEFYTQIPETYTHFLYDWRADLRYNAERLLHFLQTRRRPGQRWNIITHSQGGLLVILASKLLDAPDAFAEYVHRITLVAPPIAGTVSSARGLVAGTLAPVGTPIEDVEHAVRSLLWDESGGVQEGLLAEICSAMRTWPALYQMLPTWPAVADPEGAATGAEADLLQMASWVGHDGISADFLERARETYALMRAPLSHMQGDLSVQMVVMCSHDTPSTCVRVQGALTKEVGGHVPGDTVVPHDHTVAAWGGREDGVRIVSIDETNRQHGYLLCDEGIWQRIQQNNGA